MQPFEMQGLLAGKCLPGDMFVGESLSEYFLRQFNQRDELARQVSALQLSHDNIISSLGIKGDGPWSKLVIEYVMGLVAENEFIREEHEQTLGPYACVSLPITKSYIDGLRLHGVQSLASALWSRSNELVSEGAKKSIIIQTRVAAKLAEEFASNLRAGRVDE